MFRRVCSSVARAQQARTDGFKQSPMQIASIKHFRTSHPRKALTPLIFLVAKPAVTLVVLPLIARSFRAWWVKLPLEQKRACLERLKSKSIKLKAGLAAYVSIVGLLHFAGSEVMPVTGRRRFRMFSHQVYMDVSNFQFDIMLSHLRKLLVDESNEKSQRVKAIAMRILHANKDMLPLANRNWTVTVVDVPLKNAMVMADGRIIVFRGMIDFCKTDDELGFILCHEISHTLLGHGPELMSMSYLVDLFSIPLILPIWFLTPSLIGAAVIHVLMYTALDVACLLPHSRKLEQEADEVGIFMAARSCFDVRSAIAFWQRFDMEMKREIGLPPKTATPRIVKIFSTHPANDDRAKHLETVLNKAINLRHEHDCKPLANDDPRDQVEKAAERLQFDYDDKRRRTVMELKDFDAARMK